MWVWLGRAFRYANILILNPRIFFRKAIARIIMEIAPAPKAEGLVPAKIGSYTIDTLPSRNEFWKSIYFGCCGIEITHNIRKYLTKGGVFIDAGGGVGYFSAIASDIVGISGQVHCFEPNPSNASAIQRMVRNNSGSNIVLNDWALGVDNSFHNYYLRHSERAVECTMVAGLFMNPDEHIKVKTERLDLYLEQKEIDKVDLIKVDVEGFEYHVLKGLSSFFEKVSNKPPIICEIFMPAYRQSRSILEKFEAYMANYGYQAYNIFNNRKKVEIQLLQETADVIFIHVK